MLPSLAIILQISYLCRGAEVLFTYSPSKILLIMKKHFVFLLFVAAGQLAAGQSITSFSPTTGRIGEIITITGSGFSTAASDNSVSFGGASFSDSRAADAFEVNSGGTEIKVHVPANAQSGKVRVQVGFGGTVVTSTADFTFVAPTITGFSPTTARIGEVVTITGTGFNPRASRNSISFGGTTFDASRAVAASEVNADGTQIKVQVPVNAQTGRVRVQVGSTVVTSTADFTFVAPSITSFSPTTARAGQVITITGTGFYPRPGDNSVSFGGLGATAAFEVNVDGTEIKVRAPGRGGRVSVQVGGSEGPVATSTASFTRIRHRVVGFVPTSGRSGEIIRIRGTGFSAVARDNRVSFGGTLYDDSRVVHAFEVNSGGTEIKVRVPRNAENGRIRVRLGGTTVTSTADFNFFAPTVMRFTRNVSGRSGAIITIRGTNFDVRAAYNRVSFGGYGGSFASAFEVNTEGTEFKVRVPASAKSGSLRVRVGNGAYVYVGSFTFTRPSITSFTPTTARTGKVIAITGEGFDPRAAENRVTFWGASFDSDRVVSAFEVNAGGTEIKVRVPASAQTGRLGLRVDGYAPNEVTFAASFTFTPPSITSFTPTSDHVGDVITITGAGFSAVVGDNSVSLGGTSFAPSRAADAHEVNTDGTELKVRVPRGAQTGKLRLQVGYGGAIITSTTDFTPLLTPSITSFTPTTARTGEVITITGADFGLNAAYNSVSFGGASFDANRATPAFEVNEGGTELKVRVPAAAQNGKLTVQVGAEGPTVTSTADFTFTAPSITSFAPATARLGEVITISGEAFSEVLEDNSISFGGTGFDENRAVSAFEVNEEGTEAKVRVPGNAQTGLLRVRVGAGGAVVSTTTDFTYIAPSITSFSPTTARIGEIITIRGTGFDLSAAENSATFGGTSFEALRSIQAFEVNADGTQLKVRVPVSAQTGKLSVQIGGADGAVVTSTGDFTFVVPNITSFTPTTARIGAVITIRGTAFSAVAESNSVSFGGASFDASRAVSAFEVNEGGTEIKVRVPGNAQTGLLRVRVGGASGTVVSSSSDFTFTAPSITSFTPTTARIGAVITIRGTAFSAVADGNSVFFGLTSSGALHYADAFEVSSDGAQIKVRVPEGAQTGKVRVQIGGSDGAVVTSAGDFTFIRPSITSFTPASARIGEIITIQGTDFSAVVGENSVSFGGASFDASRAVNAFEVNVGGTQLRVRVPGGAQTGRVRVQVGGVSGTVASSSSDLTFTVPSITSFTPASARIGEIITIRGTGFSAVAGGNYVHFGGQFNEGTATSGGSAHATSAHEVNSGGTELKVRVPTHARSGRIAIGVSLGQVVSSSSGDFTLIEDDDSEAISAIRAKNTEQDQSIADNEAKNTAQDTKNTQQDQSIADNEAKNTAQDTKNTQQDQSIADNEAKNTAQDTKNTQQDQSIADNEAKNTAQDTKNTQQDQSIAANEAKNTAQDTKNTQQDQSIAANEAKNTAQDSRISANEAKNTAQDTKNTQQDQSIAANEAKNTAQDSRISANEAKNTAQDTKNTQQDQSIAANEAKNTAQDTKNTQQDQSIAANEAKNTAQDSRISANEAKNTAQDTKNTQQDQSIAANEAKNTAQDSRISANEAKNTAQDTKNTQQDQSIAANEAKNTAQDSRISANEAKNTAQDTKNTEQDQGISANEAKNTAQDNQIANLLARIRTMEGSSGGGSGGGSSTTVLHLPEGSSQSSYAYPNPASHNLYFANLSSTSSYTYKIYASTGQLVLSGALRSSDALDISRLLAGQYIVVLQRENGSEVLRSNLAVK